jgi:hypothetical protein
MAHYKSVHKDALINDESRTLLEMVFSHAPARANDSIVATVVGPYHMEPRITTRVSGPTITQALLFGPTIATLPATVVRGLDLDRLQF